VHLIAEQAQRPATLQRKPERKVLPYSSYRL
jgi:hypothetical protein